MKLNQIIKTCIKINSESKNKYRKKIEEKCTSFLFWSINYFNCLFSHNEVKHHLLCNVLTKCKSQ